MTIAQRERTMPNEDTKSKSMAVNQAVMANDIQYIKQKLDSIETQVTSHYITKDEFEPVKRLVYGMVGLILIAVVGALVNIVVHSK